jgi:hypothetical protein
MANIIPADDILAGGGGVYLDKDDKAALHTEQRPFYITGAIAEQDGNYGTQTIFTIKEKGKDEARLAFQASASVRMPSARSTSAGGNPTGEVVGSSRTLRPRHSSSTTRPRRRRRRRP